jgi:hypothetical protein
MQKTITVKSVSAGKIMTMANQEFKCANAQATGVLNRAGVVANVTIEGDAITDAMQLAYLPDSVKASEKIPVKLPDKPAQPKAPPNAMNKSVSLAYAKDLVIANKLDIHDLIPVAEVFYLYQTGELEVTNLYQVLLGNTTLSKGGK